MQLVMGQYDRPGYVLEMGIPGKLVEIILVGSHARLRLGLFEERGVYPKVMFGQEVKDVRSDCVIVVSTVEASINIFASPR